MVLKKKFKYVDESDNFIIFEQRILDRSDFTVDSESGYSQMKEIEEYDVYYRFTDRYYYYIWHNSKYSFKINSTTLLSNEKIVLMIAGTITP